MDRKSIVFLVVCFGVLFGLQPVLDHFFPPVPKPVAARRAAAPAAPSTAGTGATPGAAPAANGAPAIAGAAVPETISQWVTNPNAPEELLVVTNQEVRYTFTSRGGGLKEVTLLQYPENVTGARDAGKANGHYAPLNNPAAPPILTILGAGAEPIQGDGVFHLGRTPRGGVRAEKSLPGGLAIVKDFEFTSNYVVAATVRLANTGTQALNLPAQEWVVGAATPMGPQDKGAAVAVSWYNSNKVDQVALSYFNTNTTMLFFFPRTPATEYRAGHGDVAWVASQNQFFTLAAMPTNAAPAFVVRMIDLPPPTPAELRAAPQMVDAPHGLVTAFSYAGQTLAPGQSLTRQINLFAGPKRYDLLEQWGDRLGNNIDLVMGFTGFFGTFARLLLYWMNWFHGHFGFSFGWSIVSITVLLKLLFWPLTQYSMKSAKRMAALQPQLKALQEKYKDDPTKFSQKQMEFWKENKVNPLSGCLPALLQLPVLGGFYRMLQSAIELRDSSFLWIQDLSRPDTIFTIYLPDAFAFIGTSIPINPMPLLMGATMFWQASLTPPAPGMDPGQQKVMRYMPLIMMVILYNFSAGLALYWTVQNLLTVLQTKLTATPPAAGPGAPRPPAVVPSRKKA